MHECGQVLLVLEACALMKVERKEFLLSFQLRKEERQVEKQREDESAKAWK